MSFKDFSVIGIVLSLGIIGYLAGTQSSFAAPLLPIFGLFYFGAMLTLLGICLFAACKHRQAGWISGVLFALIFPVGLAITWLVMHRI